MSLAIISQGRTTSRLVIGLCAILISGTTAFSADGDVDSCKVPRSFSETLALSDVKIGFSETENGYAILVSSTNEARRELIRTMIVDLVRMKAGWTQTIHNGYGLEDE